MRKIVINTSYREKQTLEKSTFDTLISQSQLQSIEYLLLLDNIIKKDAFLGIEKCIGDKI